MMTKKIIFGLIVVMNLLSVTFAGRFTGIKGLHNIDEIDQHKFLVLMGMLFLALAIFIFFIWYMNYKYSKKEKKDIKNNIDDYYFKANKYFKVYKARKVNKSKIKYTGKELDLGIYLRIDTPYDLETKFKTQLLQCVKYVDKNNKLNYLGKDYLFKDICKGNTSIDNREGFLKFLEKAKNLDNKITGLLITDNSILSTEKDQLNEIVKIIQENDIELMTLY